MRGIISKFFEKSCHWWPQTRSQGGGGYCVALLRERALLLGILQAYETHGENELAAGKLQSFVTGRYGSVGESRERLGELPAVRAAFRRMQASLYAH